MSNYVVDFLKYYTVDFFFKNGQINWFGIIALLGIAVYIYFRVKKAGGFGRSGYRI